MDGAEFLIQIRGLCTCGHVLVYVIDHPVVLNHDCLEEFHSLQSHKHRNGHYIQEEDEPAPEGLSKSRPELTRKDAMICFLFRAKIWMDIKVLIKSSESCRDKGNGNLQQYYEDHIEVEGSFKFGELGFSLHLILHDFSFMASKHDYSIDIFCILQNTPSQ